MDINRFVVYYPITIFGDNFKRSFDEKDQYIDLKRGSEFPEFTINIGFRGRFHVKVSCINKDDKISNGESLIGQTNIISFRTSCKFVAKLANTKIFRAKLFTPPPPPP